VDALIQSLSGLDVTGHSPIPAVFRLASLKSDAAFDNFQAVARERQGDRLLCGRQKVKKIGAHTSGDPVAITIPLHIQVQLHSFVVMPMYEWDSSVAVQDPARVAEEQLPAFPVTVGLESGRSPQDRAHAVGLPIGLLTLR
jgi:hypothetical protein